MKNKICYLLFVICYLLCACAKQDPILPGVRESIFASNELTVRNEPVTGLPSAISHLPSAIDCPFTQDAQNIIWDGDKKIFSGFATGNSVTSDRRPVCDGNFVIAGLSTGELVRVNAKTRAISWIADIYRASNMTGGATLLDIVVPVVVHENSVYAGGLGDAFCRINKSSGAKTWCANIGVARPFVVTDVASFVLATNNMLYAIDNSDGSIYWATDVTRQSDITYDNKIISAGRMKINATNGKIIK